MRRIAMPVRSFFALAVFCCLACVLAYTAAVAPATSPGKFPAIQATNLDHTRLNLPQDFDGQLNLVILSFAREQQKEVDTWIPTSQQIESSHSKFRYYELPTMSRENPLYRWWFNAALRSNTTDKDLRSRILTAYVDKRAFKQSLHIAKEKKIVALLVDQKGRVYWRADGSLTDQYKTQLLTVLRTNGV